MNFHVFSPESHSSPNTLMTVLDYYSISHGKTNK